MVYIVVGDAIFQIPPLPDGLATPIHHPVVQSFSNRNLRHSKRGRDLPTTWQPTMLTLSGALGDTSIDNQESLHQLEVRACYSLSPIYSCVSTCT